jgi:hypothetical protein
MYVHRYKKKKLYLCNNENLFIYDLAVRSNYVITGMRKITYHIDDCNESNSFFPHKDIPLYP